MSWVITFAMISGGIAWTRFVLHPERYCTPVIYRPDNKGRTIIY